jgi:hypothetical protein
MAYDPTSDPRYIPPPGGTDVLAVDERKIEELENAQRLWDEILALMENPGWAEFRRLVKIDRDAIDAKLLREKDPTEWQFLRGQLYHADWVLQIPAEVKKQHAKAVSTLHELTREGADG